MVEIIPKTFEEIPPWQRILLYFLIFLVIAVIIGYFVIGNFYKESEDYLNTLKDRLSEEGISEILALEKEILNYKERIDDFAFIFENHILTTKFFDFIEDKTHPRIYFTELNLNPKESTASIAGWTDTFFSLGQQVSIFQQDEMVEEVNLTDTSISKKGGIDFGIDILFKEGLFRY